MTEILFLTVFLEMLWRIVHCSFKYIFFICVSQIVAPVRQYICVVGTVPYVEKSTKCSEQKCAS
jgi:hypothetical protein